VKTMVRKCRVRSAKNKPWHTLKRAKDGTVYCDCAAWRFQHKPARKRTCKHIKQAKAEGRI